MWQHEYSNYAQAYWFAARHISRQRPYLVFMIPEYSRVTQFYKNENLRNYVELFKEFFFKALKAQDEEILSYTSHQGRGYW